MKKIFLFLSSMFLIHSSLSAQLPATNLYLFQMMQLTDSLYSFSNPRFLTAFNSRGYNNQPVFFNNDELYLTVNSSETGEQTDIYSLNLRTNTRTRITNTVESEYSPTPIPGSSEFSAVRVEADADKTQRLWRFPIDRKGKGEPVFYNIKDIGYHFWINPTSVALFIVGDPHYLAIANTRSEVSNLIISNVGRSFQRLPNGNLAFVHKITPNFWQIRSLNLVTKQSDGIINTLPGSEDFVIMIDGTILMANGSKLFKFNPLIDRDWVEIADFKFYNINTISRLAVSRDNKLVFVGN